MRLDAARLLLCVALGASMMSAGPTAFAAEAETREIKAARESFRAGEKAFNEGDFERALEAFEAGYWLVPKAGFLLNMAHCERRLRHWSKARALYKRYLTADPESKQRDEVVKVMAQLDRVIAAQEHGSSTAAASVAVEEAPPSGEPPPLAPSSSAEVTSPIAPAAVRLTTTPPEADDRSSSPVYRRGWFWVAAGAIVVGAAATVFMTTRKGAAFHDDGSLGQLGSR